MDEPGISVIIPAWNSHETVAACLESMQSQMYRSFEIILVDSTPDGQTEAIVRERFPEVRFHHSPVRLTPHAARNLGTKMARGRILAFTDPDCRASPGWLEALAAAHHDGHEAAGGPVANGSGGYFEMAVHLTKYGWWLPGGPAGYRPDMPSANLSYTRVLFEQIGPFPEEWCGDTLLNRRAAARGSEVWLAPDALVYHDHRAGLARFLTERFERGRDYGEVRPRLENWSRLRCLAYAIAFPLVAVAMTARALRYAAGAGQFGRMIKALPVVAAGHLARSVGEAIAHGRLGWRKS